MRSYNTITFTLLFTAVFIFSSCFKDEPKNQECDIETATIKIEDPLSLFFDPSDATVKVPSDVNHIKFWIRPNADITHLAPEFTITPGAQISPASGSVHDFSKGPVTYNLVSEDGNFHRTYTVSFNTRSKTSKDTIYFDFEDYNLKDNSYYIWLNRNESEEMLHAWTSGNAGFKLSHSKAKPEEYPTVPIANGGLDGACVKLETKSTGGLGEMVGMPIAAGNLFIGEFDVTSALANGPRATKFNFKFDRRPVKVTGYYKYKAGEVFTDKKSSIIEGETDKATIYSVLYRNKDAEGNDIVLTGEDIKISEHVVAFAEMDDIENAENWTPFEITFDYYKEIDEETLRNNGYCFTIVFSSSHKGDVFNGAVGSILMIDKVKVICAD